MRVRVVEDDADVAFFLSTYLERSGWEVECWTENFGGLLVKELWSEDDVVLLDLQLQDSVQGVDILRWLSLHAPGVQRVVLSGNVENVDVEEVEHLAHEVIRKPPDPRSLLAALRRRDHDPSG